MPHVLDEPSRQALRATRCRSRNTVPLSLTDQSRLEPRPSRYSSRTSRRDLLVYESSYHLPTEDVEPPTDPTVIAIDADDELKIKFDFERQISLCPWAMHTQVIQEEERRIDRETAEQGREPWDRPVNERLDRSVTENTLDYIHEYDKDLGSYFGMCEVHDDPQFDRKFQVDFDMKVKQVFSLSSLPDDVKSSLKEQDLLARFRNIIFTLKLKSPGSLFQSFRDEIAKKREEADVDVDVVTPQGEVTSIPLVGGIKENQPQLLNETPWMNHHFQLEWDTDPSATQVLSSLHDRDDSIHALTAALHGATSDISEVVKVDTLAQNVSSLRQRREREEINDLLELIADHEGDFD